MSTLDHGILNLPLRKRGNIDAQIDRYKADQASEQKSARKDREAARRIAKIQAVALIDTLPAERLKSIADRCKVTPAALLKKLRSDAHFDPQFVIRALSAA